MECLIAVIIVAKRNGFSQKKKKKLQRGMSNKVKYNAPGRGRTYDFLLRKQTLYPLSYRRSCFVFEKLHFNKEK